MNSSNRAPDLLSKTMISSKEISKTDFTATHLKTNPYIMLDKGPSGESCWPRIREVRNQ